MGIWKALAPGLCIQDESLFRSSVLLALFLPSKPDTLAATAQDFLSWREELLECVLCKWIDNSEIDGLQDA